MSTVGAIMIEYVQYKARNKEDGLIYWLRKVHSSKPDIYFVFKQPEFSDRAYCGVGYCNHYEILEAIPMKNPGEFTAVAEEKAEEPKKMSLRDRLNLPEAEPKKQEAQPEKKVNPPKARQKLAQMRLF
jgi:hypothetical protein